jgi:hypothetical protein
MRQAQMWFGIFWPLAETAAGMELSTPMRMMPRLLPQRKHRLTTREANLGVLRARALTDSFAMQIKKLRKSLQSY